MNGTDRTIDFSALSLRAVGGLGLLLDGWARQRYAGPFLLRIARCAAYEALRRAALEAGRVWEPPGAAAMVRPGVYELGPLGPLEHRAALEFFDHLERLDLEALDAEEREVARELVESLFRPVADLLALELAGDIEGEAAEELYGPRN
ncbi:MAG TPA: hypothetical protein VMV46_16355 [Thermoanaerobaculia bacterium]|nr:hypothetical protein [Thermoanaerobaculia bacterium]